MRRPIIALSNRGPLSWRRNDDGEFVAKRGAGGLVTALGPALEATGGTWIATALSEDDREATAAGLDSGAHGYSVHLLDIDAATLTGALDVVANQYLWYANHDLWNRPWSPEFGNDAALVWNDYVAFNEQFAQAALSAAADIAGDSGADIGDPVVFVQDYHLALVPGILKTRNPDLDVVFFLHTPFATRSALAVLPDAWPQALVTSIASADIAGFHTARWAERFDRALHAIAPGSMSNSRVFPLGPDPESLREEAAGDAVATQRAILEDQIAGRRVVTRVDRAELSKNVLRGLRAFDEMLQRRPEMVDAVAHLVMLNPSRQALDDYRRYLDDCATLADDINSRHPATDGRKPVLFYAEDLFPRSVAGLQVADVLVANPISDGMNLVAKEGPLVNERDTVLVLSREAGAYAELDGVCLDVNPYDVAETSAAIEAALDMSDDERQERAARLREVAAANPPSAWIGAQLSAIDEIGAGR